MNQIERIIEVKIARRTIESLDRQLFYLNKDMGKLVKILMDKNAEPEALAAAQIAIDTLAPRIAALEAQRAEQYLLIGQMESEAVLQANIRVISQHGDRAQIVITYLRADGKKLSYTRHVQVDGRVFKGLSTLTNKPVTYYPESVPSEEAA